MPSEVIYGSDGCTDIRVSWGNDESGMVQVVSQAADRPDNLPVDRLLTIVNEWLVAAEMTPIDVAELKRKAPLSSRHFDGWWATLDDWGRVNRLIKVLQRARDKAFGSSA